MYTTPTKPRLGMYEKAMPDDFTWQQRFETAIEMGFDFIEISVDESEHRSARLDWSDEDIYALRRLSEQYGMPIQSLCLSLHRAYPFGSADQNKREKALEIMKKAIAFAYKLGVRCIQLAGYDVYYEPSTADSHRHFVAGMKASAALAEQAGLLLAVEIMETPYLNSLSKFEIIKREVPSPFFMAYPDVGNISAWHYDVPTELKLSQHHVVQIHLKDTLKTRGDQPGQYRDLVIGEGEVDFPSIFSALADIQYRGPLVIEMWANDDKNWQENLRIAKQRIHQFAQQSDFEL